MSSSLEHLLPDPVRRSYLAKFALGIAAVLLVTAVVAVFFYGSITNVLVADVQSDMQHSVEDDVESLSRFSVSEDRHVETNTAPSRSSFD